MKCSCLEGNAGVSKHTTDLKYLEHHNCNIPAVLCTLHIAKYTFAMKCSCWEGYADVSRRTTDLKYLEHCNCNKSAVLCTLHIAKYTLVFWAIGHYGKNSGLTCVLGWWCRHDTTTLLYVFILFLWLVTFSYPMENWDTLFVYIHSLWSKWDPRSIKQELEFLVSGSFRW